MKIFIVLNIFLMAFAIVAITACTYSITQVHTEGNAEDVVDEQQTPTSSVNASIQTPKHFPGSF